MGNALPTISGFVSPISADIADCHAATADCQVASTSTRSVIRARHNSPHCQQFEADNSHETELFSPLPTRDIALPVTDSRGPASHGMEPATPERQTRTLMGGKGLFLHRMQQDGIPVPPFTVVDTTLVARLEQQPFSAQCLLPFLPDIHHWSNESFSLEQLRRIVTKLPHPQQAQWLKGLSGFIASEDFYQQVKNISAAKDIRHLYLALGQPSGEACIVRSSGVEEDRFGDAQAGRYDSRVHGGGDILKTCLQVLSSAYRPEVCPAGRVKPMALVLQQCIHCQLGGVVMSDSTFEKDDIQVEYAQGQPRGAVCGNAGIRPHRYRIRRGDGDNSKPDRQFTAGDVTTQFVLEKITSEETGEAGYIERRTTVIPDAKDIMLTEEILQKLQHYTEQLEDMFCCPVDVEFGVDGQWELFVFQCRPVTRLPGSTQFSAPAPSRPLAEGTMVSEGCCSGVVLVVSEPVSAEQIPSGAIVFAEHASDWMLAPDILQRVGGFVFRLGGTNDHVAITLRQAGIPCLVADTQYCEALTQASGQQVTLVAGSFVGSPGAYLLVGDQSAYWQANSTASGLDITSSPITILAKPPDFTRVDDGFGWLNRQNNRLLDYFHADRLISHCLGPGRSKAVSMSANRSTLLQQLDMEIQQLQKDLELFVSGYQDFLGLAVGFEPDAIPSEVQPFTGELPHLERRWGYLKDAIANLRSKVVLPLAGEGELPARRTNFRQWLRDCQALQDNLQKLTQPLKVSGIHSAHDLIYWLHQRFVSALAPVAEASGLGQITEIAKDRILVDLLPRGVFGLLNDNCISVLAQFNTRTLRMLNMVDAAFISAELGTHVCTITMLEQAEGGKGRTLQLDIADDFSQDRNSSHLQGKLKRFWFLVQTLRCALMDISSRPMAISFNQSLGKMTIEYTRVNCTSELQAALVKLVTVLTGLCSMDISINEFNRGQNTDKWNFETLVKKCQNALDEPGNSWTFKHCLVLDAIKSRQMHTSCWHYDYTFLSYLDSEYRLFFAMARKAYHCIETTKGPNRNSKLRQIFTATTRHLEPNDAARIIKEVLCHMAIESEWIMLEACIELLRKDFDLEHDRDLVLVLVQQNPIVFKLIPNRFKDDIEIAKCAIGQHGNLLEYAGNHLKNDRSLVMLAVNSCSHEFFHASTDLKNDKDFVLPLLSRNACIYQYLSDRLKSDPDIQAALRNKDDRFTQ